MRLWLKRVFMGKVTDVAQLEALYGAPAKATMTKVVDHVTPLYAKWIAASRLCILSTVGPDGTDGSPRGDDGCVVCIADPKTVLIPDWRGNNRMDSLRNIVTDGRVSLLFLVRGSNTCVRINGRAEVHVDDKLRAGFDDKGRLPRSVIVISVAEVYSQCARALMRAQTWDGTAPATDLPSVGDFLREVDAGFDGADYDATWPDRASKTLW